MCKNFCKNNGKRCRLLKWFAGGPMILGLGFIFFGMISLIFPYFISIFTSELPSNYIYTGKFMIFSSYVSLINFMTVGVMMMIFGFFAGIVVIGIVEPFIKFIKYG